MTITGWTSKGWVVENSWGGDWGKHGAAILPYSYPIMEAWTGIDTIKTKASLFQLNRKITKGE
jgi:C1A family cysteine protease